jgi:hypothetical protein
MAIIVISYDSGVPKMHTFSDVSPEFKSYTQDNTMGKISVLNEKLDTILNGISSVDFMDHMRQAFKLAGSSTNDISKEFDVCKINKKGAVML